MVGSSTSEFADKVSEIMPAITREFYRLRSGKSYKMQITFPQFIVLDTLVREGGSRMTDLANLLNVTTAAMTGIIERLVRERCVRRENDRQDRRIIKVRPTAKGARIVRNAIEERKTIIGRIFGVISERERDEYLRILTLVKESLEERNRA